MNQFNQVLVIRVEYEKVQKGGGGRGGGYDENDIIWVQTGALSFSS